MKKLFCAVLSLVFMLTSVCACSATKTSTANHAAADNKSSADLAVSSSENDKYFAGKAIYDILVGEYKVTLIKTDNGGDDYFGNYILKCNDSVTPIDTPASTENGLKIEADKNESFIAKTLTDGTNKCELLVFVSDKSLDERFATCFICDDVGIHRLKGTQYPAYAGDITVDGLTVGFSDGRTYEVDTKNYILKEI